MLRCILAVSGRKTQSLSRIKRMIWLRGRDSLAVRPFAGTAASAPHRKTQLGHGGQSCSRTNLMIWRRGRDSLAVRPFAGTAASAPHRKTQLGHGGQSCSRTNLMIWRRGRDSLAVRPFAGTAASAPHRKTQLGHSGQSCSRTNLMIWRRAFLVGRPPGKGFDWRSIFIRAIFLFPGFAALVGFGVQLCGLGSRASAFTQRENRDFPCVRTIAYGKRIARFQYLRRFDPLAVDLHLAAFNRIRRQAARLVEPGRP